MQAKLVCFAILFVFLLSSTIVHAQSKSRSPTELRSAFIYNIAKYVSWPPHLFKDGEPDLQLCFIEKQQEKHSTLFSQNPNLTVAGRRVAVNSLPSIADIDNNICHLLFIDDSYQDDNQLQSNLQAINRNTITIGMSKGFLDQGGMSAILPSKGKMSIFVNRHALDGSQLKLSSQLLKRVNFHL